MSTGATIADWVGTAVTAAAAVLYGYFSLYPRKEGGHKIALWLLAPAIMGVVLESSLIIDIGSTLRSDGKEFNFERWIYYTVSLLCTSAVLASYQWFDLVDGWYLLAFGTLTGATTTLAGISTGDRRWVLIASALAFGVTWLVFLFYKPRYNSAEAKNARTRTSRIAAGALSVTYALSIGLSVAVFMFSSALLNIMSFELATWLYFATTCLTTGLPLLAVLDYHPDPLTKSD